VSHETVSAADAAYLAALKALAGRSLGNRLLAMDAAIRTAVALEREGCVEAIDARRCTDAHCLHAQCWALHEAVAVIQSRRPMLPRRTPGEQVEALRVKPNDMAADGSGCLVLTPAGAIRHRRSSASVGGEK